MRFSSLRPASKGKRIVWVAWGFALLLFLSALENIWFDPRLRSKFLRIPSLVLRAQSGTWFLAVAVGAIVLTFFIVSQTLLIRNRGIPLWVKIGTGLALLVLLSIGVQRFYMTNEQSRLLRLHASGKTHKVILSWGASKSQTAGYNVYRSTVPESNYMRINTSLVQGLTFTDSDVESGVTYHYVTRAADGLGSESPNSPEFSIRIP